MRVLGLFVSVVVSITGVILLKRDGESVIGLTIGCTGAAGFAALAVWYTAQLIVMLRGGPELRDKSPESPDRH